MANNNTDLASAPSRSGRVGWPQKYVQPWLSVMKRVYLEENTFSVLRLLKSQQHFTSNDATVRWLISRHEYLSLSCSNWLSEWVAILLQNGNDVF